LSVRGDPDVMERRRLFISASNVHLFSQTPDYKFESIVPTNSDEEAVGRMLDDHYPSDVGAVACEAVTDEYRQHPVRDFGLPSNPTLHFFI
ncbi:MAG: hypothetical protein AAFR27_11195, partial [Pseudomonadota bacterium]